MIRFANTGPKFPTKQRGLSFIGLICLAVVLIFLGYVVAKTVPVITEHSSLTRALKQASAGSTVVEVRQIYERVASVEYLEQYADPIRPADLQVSKQNDNVVVQVEYTREIPLLGPAYLIYKLRASSN